ncbi:SCO6745 family protein [Flexivirga meconopsidis]|uniref:SCO6745 family protein n=1 Tax=Flexivirga meconopsidis TaxID=2977121 RepID=UPI002240D4E3|nr:hypothetical protein [Flexivirga meconopsidis]
MTLPLAHDEAARGLARQTYRTLEPLHLLAYFNPYARETQQKLGLRWTAYYVGARGGPLGEVPARVLTSTFFNFNGAIVEPAWDAAKARGLDEVMAAREQSVARTLSDIFGPDEAAATSLVARWRPIAQALPTVGRPLAAAWAALPWPDEPQLQLWHAASLLREWRGDGHIAVLVQSGLTPAEALVFHEAQHPDAAVKKSTLGREMAQGSRGWSDEEWAAAVETLRARGLLERDAERYTADGVAFYDALEQATDDAAAGIWSSVDDGEGLIADTRPLVKRVIDAGVLPGTTKKL